MVYGNGRPHTLCNSQRRSQVDAGRGFAELACIVVKLQCELSVVNYATMGKMYPHR